jgi:hypothetical protein
MDLGFQACGGCNGSGLGGAGTCPYCGGSGTSSIPADRQCHSCFGTGYIRDVPELPKAAPSGRQQPRRQAPAPPPLVQPEVEKYEGAKSLFRRHGHGEAVHAGGLVFQGRWSRGRWHGNGTLTNEGRWVYTGQFKKGMLAGTGSLEFSDGSIFEGKFRKSAPSGKGRLTLSDGSRFEGKWRNCASAKGKFIDENGKQFKAEIVGGDLLVKRGFFSKREKIVRVEFREIFAL